MLLKNYYDIIEGQLPLSAYLEPYVKFLSLLTEQTFFNRLEF